MFALRERSGEPIEGITRRSCGSAGRLQPRRGAGPQRQLELAALGAQCETNWKTRPTAGRASARWPMRRRPQPRGPGGRAQPADRRAGAPVPGRRPTAIQLRNGPRLAGHGPPAGRPDRLSTVEAARSRRRLDAAAPQHARDRRYEGGASGPAHPCRRSRGIEVVVGAIASSCELASCAAPTACLAQTPTPAGRAGPSCARWRRAPDRGYTGRRRLGDAMATRENGTGNPRRKSRGGAGPAGGAAPAGGEKRPTCSLSTLPTIAGPGRGPVPRHHRRQGGGARSTAPSRWSPPTWARR